jgi:arginine deiminase
MNLYFLRDQMITTARGVVLGRMSSEQRAVETEIVRFVLRKLRIQPLYEVVSEGRLEGGDYMPAGGTVFIGQGLRTNAEAIAQLLERRVFGTCRVVVVKDPWRNQEQMHLDSYFNIAGPNLAVLAAERMDVRDESGRVLSRARPERRTSIDDYEWTAQGYRRTRTDGDFARFLTAEMGFRLIAVSSQDQARYATNFLNVGGNHIIAVAGASPGYRRRLHGVCAEWLTFTHLTGGYGGPHCLVQVLHRRRF